MNMQALYGGNDKVSAEVKTLSIEECKRLLERNTHNRRVRVSTVDKYAGQMTSGQWELNGEPIIVADNGDLMDGQHRLLAAVKANRPLRTLIVYNVARFAFDTINTGAGRNASDVLQIRGVAAETARIAAAAAVRCILFDKFGHTLSSRANSHLTTPRECSEYVLVNKRLIEIAEQIQAYGRNGRILASGGAAFLWFYMEKKEPLETENFFDGFLTGANLNQYDPRLVLRTKFESFRVSQRKWNLETRLKGTVRAWDWHVRGKDCLYPNNMFRELDSAYELLK